MAEKAASEYANHVIRLQRLLAVEEVLVQQIKELVEKVYFEF